MNIQFLMTRAKCGFNLFSHSRKFGDIGRSIQAGADVAIAAATNATNAKMNKNTNDMNYRIAQETNEMNERNVDKTNALQYQMHVEDMNFNAEQAQIAREWDAPEAQRQRLIDAGINPLMLGGSFSSSSPVASAPSAPSLDVAQANPVTLNPNMLDLRPSEISEALGRAFGFGIEDAEEKKIREETEGIKLDNQSKLFEIEHLPERFMNEKEMHEWARNEENRKKAMFSLDKRFRRSQTAYYNAQKVVADETAKEIKERTKQYEEQLQFITKYHDKQLKQIDAEIASIRAQESAYYAQAESAYAAAENARATARLTNANADIVETFGAESAELDNASKRTEIDKTKIEIETEKIKGLSIIQNSDLSENEKEEFAKFLAENPDYNASKLFHAAKEITSHDKREFVRKFGLAAFNFLSQVILKTMPK